MSGLREGELSTSSSDFQETDTVRPSVFMHIGHGKTGSSAFQSAIAQASEALQKNGILYHSSRSFRAAREFKITSGNISVKDPHGWFDKEVVPVLRSNRTYRGYIFSNESIFYAIEPLFRGCEEFKGSHEFKIVLVLRDPLEILSSEYQQSVKRGGCRISFSEYIRRRNYRVGTTEQSCEIIKRLEGLGISYMLINYSHERRNVTKALASAIGISDYLDYESIKGRVVNRSLSLEELQAVATVNLIWGQEVGRRISDALVNTLPNVESIMFLPAPDEHVKLVQNLKKPIKFLNQRLKKAAALKIGEPGKPERVNDLILDLSPQQIKIIRRQFRAALKEKAP